MPYGAQVRPFYLYMLRCSDGSLYTGHTDDLEGRLWEHRAGLAHSYTRLRRPVRLVYVAEFASREEALTQERRIKGWSRAKKLALIAGEWESLQGWSRRRRGPFRPSTRPRLAQDERDQDTARAAGTR